MCLRSITLLAALAAPWSSFETSIPVRNTTLQIRGATVVTLSIGTLPRGDVAVSGDRIVRVAPRIEAPADRVLEASGLFVLPGFAAIVLGEDLTLDSLAGTAEDWLAAGITEVYLRREDDLLDELVRVRLGGDHEARPVARLLELGTVPGRTCDRLRAAHRRGELATRRDANLLLLGHRRDLWIGDRLATELRWSIDALAMPVSPLAGSAPVMWRAHEVEGRRDVLALGRAGPTHLVWQAASSVADGTAPEDALRALTQWPAELLDPDHVETGRIVEGALADLVIFDRHPLSANARCLAAIVGGELVWVEARFRRERVR